MHLQAGLVLALLVALGDDVDHVACLMPACAPRALDVADWRLERIVADDLLYLELRQHSIVGNADCAGICQDLHHGLQ